MGDATPEDPASSTWKDTSSLHRGTPRSDNQPSQAQSNGLVWAEETARSHHGQILHDTGSSPGQQANDSDDDVQYRSADEEATKLVPNEPSKPRKVTQKKKIEQANFAQWLNINRANLSTKPVKNPASQQEESLRYMVKSWEGGEKIIGTPRDYQLELFERAKSENTIAVLDTGKPCHVILHQLRLIKMHSRIRQDPHCRPAPGTRHQPRARGPKEWVKPSTVFLSCRESGFGLPATCSHRV